MTPNEHTAAAIDVYRLAMDKILYYAANGYITEETACHFADRLTDAFKAAGTVPEETEFEVAEDDGKPAGLPEL